MSGQSRATLRRPLISLQAPAPLIVFDGSCVLCSSSAQFVLRHDRDRIFRLTTAQGAVGQALYRRLGLPGDRFETMLVVEGEQVFTYSDAALRIAAGLPWPWRAGAALAFIPRQLRDPLYRWVARNRYRWFGRREACWMPRPADADRIL